MIGGLNKFTRVGHVLRESVPLGYELYFVLHVGLGHVKKPRPMFYANMWLLSECILSFNI